MGALYELFELAHACGDVLGDVGVDVVVVGDGVGASGAAFDDVGVVAGDAVAGVVGVVGVLDDAGVPDVGDAERAYMVEDGGGDEVEFAGAVAVDGAVGNGVGAIVGVEAREELVDDGALYVGVFFHNRVDALMR